MHGFERGPVGGGAAGRLLLLVVAASYLNRKVRGRRDAPWRRFARGVFHSGYWRWGYPVGPRVPAALCPFDDCELLHHAFCNEPKRILRCPLCSRECVVSDDVIAGVASMVIAEIDTSRWRTHADEIDTRRAELRAAIGDSVRWDAARELTTTEEQPITDWNRYGVLRRYLRQPIERRRALDAHCEQALRAQASLRVFL